MLDRWFKRTIRMLSIMAALVAGMSMSYATVTDIATVPLGTAPTSTVLPNLMFVLDDSGSMARDYTPDQANDNGTCKSCSSGSCDMTGASCQRGYPPYYAAPYNIQYYNPAVTYKPGTNYLGVSLGNMTASAVKVNPFDASDTNVLNVATQYRDIWWCNTSSPSSGDFSNSAICQRNGINTANPFNYNTGGLPSTTYRFGFIFDSTNPHYYTISPVEHCTDNSLTVCTASTTPVTISGVVYDRPAPVRWCRTTAATTAAAPVTGGSPVTCRATVDGTYRYPRYGNFTRFDILTGNTYFRANTRSDCSGAFGAGGCTYAEELQNFANWAGYYRTRMLQMKTISGRVFASLDERYRIGFLTINAADATQYLKISKFETSPTTHKQDWFTKFYAQLPGSGTPLREALSRVGRHYAGQTDGINSFMPDDPVQYACQPNYTLLTTDGYWNGAGGQKINSSGMDNQDNVPGTFVSRATGTLDGVGTTVTEVTPTVTLQQQICVGNAATTFPVSNTACGCAAGEKRVKQQTRTDNSTTVFTDGIAGSPTTGTVYTFQDITACTTPLIVTTVTPVTRVEEEALVANATSTFPTINGVSSGANQAGTCSAGQARIKRRTTTYNQTVVSNDGVAGAPTFSATSYAFTDVGTCTTVTTTVVDLRRERTQWVTVSEGSGLPTAFAAAANGTNVQTTYSCSGSGTRTMRLQREIQYNRTTTTVGAGAPTVTFGPTVAGPTFSVIENCSTSGKTAAAPNFATLSSNTTVTGGPTPAATTVTNGTPTSTNNGGTTVATTISPNPSVPTPGTPTSTTSFGGASNTLADVAMYYYKTDLRTSMNDIVKGPNGTFLHQHMVTFTLGLGLDGQMLYDPNYETATSGDFVKIKTGATGCSWTTGTCNWPVPVGDTPTALDDLWHAAVNGRGKYFSAKDPTSLENGLTSTLSAINLVTGAAASAATSTPNLTPTDNKLFSSTYRTQKWDGEVIAQSLDPVTGDIVATPVWTAAGQLNARTSASADTRTIYTFDGASASKLKPFLYASLSASEQAFFNNKCAGPTLSQCGPFDPTRLTAANNGANLVNWLRGQRGNELSTDLSTGLYRAREFLLGDTVNSKPVFVGPPNLLFADAVTPDYPTFKTANASRQKVLYIAANDGMLHALNADTGAEMWAYIPKMIMPNLWKLASKNYDISHNFYVDGSPSVMDIYSGGAWKTILVSGLNSGGRGYFALDITDPSSPKALWEICSDAALCAIADTDMGMSFGVPVITKRADGTPIVIVTSGYNNVTPGSGGGFLYILDAATGAVLEKVGTTISGTNVGDTTTPSGFAKIAGFALNAAQNNTATTIYGGDLLGNVWKFDLTVSPVTAQRLATLKDGSTPPRPQSITTRPEVTRFSGGFNVVYFGTGRLLGGTDLGDPALLTPPEPYAFQQSIYAIKDTGTDLGNLRLPAANLVQQTMSAVTATTRTVTNNPVDFATNNGWYLDLNPGNASPGERVNLDLTLVKGVLIATTNEPNTQACSDGGNGFLYQLSYRSGSYIPGTPGGIVGGQIASSLLVGSVFYRTTTGSLIGLTRSSTGTPIKTAVNPGGAGGSGQRVSWRELVQ